MFHVRKVILVVFWSVFFHPGLTFAASILVSWNANTESDLAGYKVYSGTQSGVYGAPADVGNVTSYQFTSVQAGTTYYFALTAYDTSGNESGYSAEVSVSVPAPDATPPTGTIAINSGRADTPSRAVTLTLSAADPGGTVTSMMFSNDGMAWSDEVPYAVSHAWTLTAGDGVKTVYVNFRDAAGNWMNTPASASITLRLDTDRDGLPDSWEDAYGLDPDDPSDASLDPDLDGYTNLEEYSSGTNPVSASGDMPVADAGPDQRVSPTLVHLDGSASSDPHHLPLQYSWSFMSGPVTVYLDNASASRASFTGIKAGVYRFRLTVSNGRSSSSDTVEITLVNAAPTVDAGGDMTVDAGTRVTLHASGTDPNQDTLSYTWDFVSGPTISLPDLNGQDITLTPFREGQYIFSVTCSDGVLSSDADDVIVMVNAVNHAPTAEAGPDQSIKQGQPVTLNGAGSSDPDGDTLAYYWREVSGPAMVTFGSPSKVTAAFTPSAVGTYVFELIVSDGTISSLPDIVTVTVVKLNTVPVADAGSDQTVLVGDAVTLDAGGSYDPDDDVLIYAWSQTSGAAVVMSGASTAMPTFTPTASGVLGFRVSVSDGQVVSEDTVQVTVNSINHVPVAEAGDDRTIQVYTTATLDGSGSSDVDRDALSYVWTQVSGPQVSLYSPDTAAASFTPAQAGTYVFGLKVFDGKDTSLQDTVTVIVQDAAVSIALLTPQMGSVISTNPTFTWSGNGFTKFKAYVAVGNKSYKNIYSGKGKSCKMSSLLWSLFIPSGTTVNWYVEGTTSNKKTVRSSPFNFKKK